jgi:hypothetical protein
MVWRPFSFRRFREYAADREPLANESRIALEVADDPRLAFGPVSAAPLFAPRPTYRGERGPGRGFSAESGFAASLVVVRTNIEPHAPVGKKMFDFGNRPERGRRIWIEPRRLLRFAFGAGGGAIVQLTWLHPLSGRDCWP